MRAVATLQNLGREKHLGEKEIFGLALALEECGSNIVNHALRGDARQKFQVLIEHTASALTIELRDHGPEFDPTQAPSNGEKDEQHGGWGIQLVRRYIDEIRYRRENGENVLRLTKRLVQPNGQK
jgi:anti-sigma regulatory factor (Ser/Thr protein kinase)